jgi:exosortase A-associated hydrolase 2
MQEKPFFFPNNNYNLFGVLHLPENTPVVGGFVFCHPFAEEKLWTHRVYVTFARELVERGYAVLRFDYMGQGDSDGEFENSTVTSRLSDIKCAINAIKELASVKTINLLGLRFGAMLAAIVAEEVDCVSKLILWNPVTNGNKYMQENLRTNLTTQLATYKKIQFDRKSLVQQMKEGKTVDIDGYYMTYELFTEACAIDLCKRRIAFSGDCFISQIGKASQPIRKEIQDFAVQYSQVTITQSAEEPFWKEIRNWYNRADNLFTDTLNWLEKTE